MDETSEPKSISSWCPNHEEIVFKTSWGRLWRKKRDGGVGWQDRNLLLQTHTKEVTTANTTKHEDVLKTAEQTMYTW